MGEWQQPLRRKSLKKRRLRGLTAHNAPLLPRPWVGSGPAWRPLITGGRGEGAGDCFGSGFSQGQGAQAVFKNKRKSQKPRVPAEKCPLGSPVPLRAPPTPSRDPGHKWLTAAAGA